MTRLLLLLIQTAQIFRFTEDGIQQAKALAMLRKSIIHIVNRLSENYRAKNGQVLLIIILKLHRTLIRSYGHLLLPYDNQHYKRSVVFRLILQ